MPRVAVCIVGQPGRLELDTKAAMLRASPDFDAFVVLQATPTLYSETVLYESSVGRRCHHLRPSSESIRRALSPVRMQWVNTLFDAAAFRRVLNASEYRTLRAVRLHVNQYQLWRACALDIQQHEVAIGRHYEYVLRLRDNALVASPDRVADVFRADACTTKPCFAWRGVHDKTMACPRRFLQPMLRDPIEDSLFGARRYRRDSNTETTLARVLRQAGVRVQTLASFPVYDTRICACNGTAVTKRCLAPKDCAPTRPRSPAEGTKK